MSYKEKYLKYKTKYSLLKEQKGGGNFLTDDDYDKDPSYAMFNFSPEFLEKNINISTLCISFFQCYATMYVSFYHLEIFKERISLFKNYIEFLKTFIVITNFFRIARELTKTIDDREIQIYKIILSNPSIFKPKKFLDELTSISDEMVGGGKRIFYTDRYREDKEFDLWDYLIINFHSTKTDIQQKSTLPPTETEERNRDINFDFYSFENEKRLLIEKQRFLERTSFVIPIQTTTSVDYLKKPFLDYLNQEILTICRKNNLDHQGIELYKEYYINIKRRANIVRKMNDNVTQLTEFSNRIDDMYSHDDYFPSQGVTPHSKLPEATKRLVKIGYDELMYQLKTKYCIS